jgi:capsular polysaccharide transport system permease protein
MGNEERIKRWLAERQARSATGAEKPPPLTDDPDPAPRSERAELQGDAPERPAAAPSASDEARLEEARLAILERRRERWRMLVRRAMLFVAVPLLSVLLYIGLIATPLYQGEAVFTVQTSADAAPSPSAGLFGVGAASSTIADAFKAREFILSRPMMDHMEERHGFMSHFASFRMDPLTRFRSPLGLNYDPLDYYRKRVRVAVDVQEGILRLYVQARTDEDAIRFGNAILAAAEAHVNRFSDKISEDQIAALTRDVQEAERQVAETRRSLAAVQARRGDVAPQQTAAAVYQLISQLELQLAEAERERNALLEQGLTESPLLPRLSARVEELRSQIAEQRQRLANPGGGSLIRTLNEYESATARTEIAQARWESTLNTLQQAYLRILEQRRYFVLVVGMSAGAKPLVRDIAAIAIPILVLIALIYAILFIVRQVRAETGTGGFQFSRVVEQWRRR